MFTNSAIDDHDEFNATFEALRVATEPHLPISLAGIVEEAACIRCDRPLDGSHLFYCNRCEQ